MYVTNYHTLLWLVFCRMPVWQNLYKPPTVEFMQALRLRVGFRDTELAAPALPPPIPRRRMY